MYLTSFPTVIIAITFLTASFLISSGLFLLPPLLISFVLSCTHKQKVTPERTQKFHGLLIWNRSAPDGYRSQKSPMPEKRKYFRILSLAVIVDHPQWSGFLKARVWYSYQSFDQPSVHSRYGSLHRKRWLQTFQCRKSLCSDPKTIPLY